MKILLTGANGFLGFHLCSVLLAQGHQLMATGKGISRLPFDNDPGFSYQEADLNSRAAIRSVINAFAPACIVHAGAVSKPDECERLPEQAYSVNVKGTSVLLEAAASCRAKFIFLSTDFVFNGDTGMYREEDATGPVNFYGQTKLEAETLVRNYEIGWAIVRTVLVYGPNHSGRKNLLDIVREKLEQGEEYRVVDDQLRTPTYVGDLASGIAKIIAINATGIFHLSGAEPLSPFEMAVRTASFLKLDASLLKRVNASTFREPARRPLKTGFNISKAKAILDYQPVPFETGLRLTFGNQK